MIEWENSNFGINRDFNFGSGRSGCTSTSALTIKMPSDAFKRSIERLEPLVDVEAE